MDEVPVLKIIRLCRNIDEIAQNMYSEFAQQCQIKELREFWHNMSGEESAHIKFWKRFEQLEIFPDNIFIDPEKVIAELDHAKNKMDEYIKKCSITYNISNSFILSYRMEFYLLHPAFAMLFELLGPMVGPENPENNYDLHIAGFIDMLAKFGEVTPELELLGETLQRLWKENKNLAHQATRDELTGCLNRRGFFAIAAQLSYLSQRSKFSVGVLMIDLDHFRTVNDRLGHLGGDKILKKVAKLISSSLRSSDLMGRYGGEEFIVLLPSTGTQMTAAVAEKIRSSLAATTLEGLAITLSIGIAESIIDKDPQEALQTLIKQADLALYDAKNSGRDKIIKYINN